MRLIRPLLLTMTAGVVLSSCIKEEALNAEADITNITVKGTELIRKPVITNNTIQLYVNGWADVTHLAPVFNLTEGATSGRRLTPSLSLLTMTSQQPIISRH